MDRIWVDGGGGCILSWGSSMRSLGCKDRFAGLRTVETLACLPVSPLEMVKGQLGQEGLDHTVEGLESHSKRKHDESSGRCSARSVVNWAKNRDEVWGDQLTDPFSTADILRAPQQQGSYFLFLYSHHYTLLNSKHSRFEPQRTQMRKHRYSDINTLNNL